MPDRIFQSSTNHVSVVQFEGCAAVCKAYGSVSKASSLRYPLGRSQIEANLLDLVGSMVGGLVEVPKLLKNSPNPPYNVLTLLPGVPLRDAEIATWPAPTAFFSLGLSLARLSEISPAVIEKIFEGFQSVEEVCARIVSRHKGLPVVCGNGAMCLSLGDVGIQNILTAEGRLSLIDFEFAHRSTAGKDVGIFLAELEAHERICDLSRAYREELLAGYCRDGADRSAALWWSAQAFPYHYHKQFRYRHGREQ